MIVGNALEGESYVGKTSCLDIFRGPQDEESQEIVIIPEYSTVGEFVPFPRESIADLGKAIRRIIELEQRRSDFLANFLAKKMIKYVFFDRGLISCIAFEYAAQKNGSLGSAIGMAEAFQQALDDKTIIVPKGMIHLTASRSTIEARRAIDRQKGKGPIIKFLQDENVRSDIDYAFKLFGDFLPDHYYLLCDTDNKDPKEISASVLQFINEQKNVFNADPPNYVSYAEKLTIRRQL
ncbi:MAG: hypothetical protein Q7R97_01900 [Candidatus Daviesbacteria bacterium]|nr:hypothetical protein [Candidatus Daviesbacteria bacterium]